MRGLRAVARLALLLASAGLWVPAGRAEEPARFRECPFGWIPWAKTIEEARGIAKRDGRLVLAFLFAWNGKEYEAGYDGAERVRATAGGVTAEQAQAAISQDPGWLKEQAVFAALLGDPALSALVARSFVPVRLRMHTWHFFEGGPGPFEDPLPRLGTSDRATKPPAILVATAEGKLVRQVQRMGVFDPHLVRRLLLQVLRENPRRRPARPRGDAADAKTIAELAAGGDLEEARRRLTHVPEADRARAALEALRLDAVDGDLAAVEKGLRALPAAPERDALLAEVLLRRGRPAEVAAIAGLGDRPDGRVTLAAALERLGRDEEATAIWLRVAAEEPDSPRAARAALRLAPDAPRAREWDAAEEPAFDPAATTTVCGRGGAAAAVRWLLGQQDADGAWRDPRGPPDGWGLAVPRTALCVLALRAHRGVAPAEAGAAIARGTAFVDRWCDDPRDDVWSLTYALELQLVLLTEEKSSDTRRRAQTLLAHLAGIEHDGGFTYVAPPRLHTFNTAPILLLLVRARDAGLPVEAPRIDRSARFLEANRVGKSEVFHYGPTMEPMSGEKGKTDETATSMRSAVCELALFAAGAQTSTAGMERAVDLFLARQAAGRGSQKIFETNVDVTTLVDSYRWFFGLRYATEAAKRLPEAKRHKALARLAAVLWAEQEVDGSFVDSQVVGKGSSTALALLTAAVLKD